LSRTTGPVLDPIFSLRRRFTLEPGTTTQMAFVTGAADSREGAIAIAGRFRDFEAINQAFAGAKAHCQSELRELEITPDEVALFNRLAASVVFTNSGLRDLDAAATHRLEQSSLWKHSISGDLPIVLVRVVGVDDVKLIGQVVRWRCGPPRIEVRSRDSGRARR
jgi:cellobiose phosphorylase